MTISLLDVQSIIVKEYENIGVPTIILKEYNKEQSFIKLAINLLGITVEPAELECVKNTIEKNTSLKVYLEVYCAKDMDTKGTILLSKDIREEQYCEHYRKYGTILVVLGFVGLIGIGLLSLL